MGRRKQKRLFRTGIHHVYTDGEKSPQRAELQLLYRGLVPHPGRGQNAFVPSHAQCMIARSCNVHWTSQMTDKQSSQPGNFLSGDIKSPLFHQNRSQYVCLVPNKYTHMIITVTSESRSRQNICILPRRF